MSISITVTGAALIFSDTLVDCGQYRVPQAPALPLVPNAAPSSLGAHGALWMTFPQPVGTIDLFPISPRS